MKLHEEKYTNSDDQFEDMRQLIITSYAHYQWPFNWNLARLEDWRYGGNSLRLKSDPEYLHDKAHFWRDDSGGLVGYAIAEGSGSDICIQLLPEPPELAEVMMTWVVEVWAQSREKVEMVAYASDSSRHKLLSAFGFEPDVEVGRLRQYDLNQTRQDSVIDSRYKIETLAQNRSHAKVVEAVNNAFARPSKLNEDWLRSKMSAPSMSEEGEFSIIAPDGEHASFCFAWIDRANNVAELDPIGTQPQFQKQGLAKALIFHVFEALRSEGIGHAYIVSGPEPAPSNRLYESLDPSATWIEQKWVRPTSAR